MINVVDVGGGKGSRFAQDFINEYIPSTKDAELNFARLDIDPKNEPDILQDITKPIPKKWCGKFDVVYASHIAEHISYWDGLAVINNLLSLLKIDGYLMLLVPALEWACKQVLSGVCDLSVMAVLYGSQENEWMNHKSGYTKAALALVAKRLELELVEIHSTKLFVYINEKEYHALQHVMLAKKKVENKPLEIGVKRVFVPPINLN